MGARSQASRPHHSQEQHTALVSAVLCATAEVAAVLGAANPAAEQQQQQQQVSLSSQRDDKSLLCLWALQSSINCLSSIIVDIVVALLQVAGSICPAARDGPSKQQQPAFAATSALVELKDTTKNTTGWGQSSGEG